MINNSKAFTRTRILSYYKHISFMIINVISQSHFMHRSFKYLKDYWQSREKKTYLRGTRTSVHKSSFQ